MDRDPNQLAFNLRCEHCQHTFKSQGSLRAHLKHGEPRCRRSCIRCGCCAQLFLSKDQLTAHLNQPGAYRRPSVIPHTHNLHHFLRTRAPRHHSYNLYGDAGDPSPGCPTFLGQPSTHGAAPSPGTSLTATEGRADATPDPRSGSPVPGAVANRQYAAAGT